MRVSEILFAIRKWTCGARVPDRPHMDPAALALFETSLRDARRYLEFGAGGSTVMAATLGKSGVSIEGDRAYSRAVSRKLRRLHHGIDLIHVDLGPTMKWGKLRRTEPTPENVAAWTRYVTCAFDNLPGPFFDLILVDGRFRVACALHTLAAGFARHASFRLLVDDYNDPTDPRPDYTVIEEYAPITTLAGEMAVFDVTPGTLRQAPDDAGAARRDPR